MRISLLILLVSLGSAVAQRPFVPLDFYTSLRAESALLDSAERIHPEIKPYTGFDLKSCGSDFLYQPREKRFNRNPTPLACYPIPNALPLQVSGNHPSRGFEGSAGVSLVARLGTRILAEGNAIAGWYEPAPYMQRIADSLFVIPGMGRAFRNGSHYGFQQSTFTLGWKASHHVQVFAGRGKTFIGSGYRSILLSDYAMPYNYFRTDVNVWRIKYMILYSQMNNALGYPSQFGRKGLKYSTMHYLSLNITKWWSVGAFETVVWQASDSLSKHRHYDINYLNPIIFFRPVEYSLGSSDNVLMGGTTNIRPTRGMTVYGSLMLDEFLMREVLAPLFKKYSDSSINTGFWGNKQAYQVGIKYLDPLRLSHTAVIAEFNAARPYTFSHTNAYQSYTHLNQVLGHPLGSNFIEWVGIVAYQPDNWMFSWRNTYSRKGYSNNLGNMGDDPLLSNVSRAVMDDAERMYGYYMLQGRKVDVFNSKLEVAYMLVPDWNLRLEASIQYRWQRSGMAQDNAVIYQVGVRTAIWNEYRDL